MATSENHPAYKNDWQNTVLATFVSGFLLVVVFLCPWRVESTGVLKWSPIYQPPMSYVQSYDGQYGRQGGSRIEADEAHIAYDILVLEVIVFTVACGILYVFSADSDIDADEEKISGKE